MQTRTGFLISQIKQLQGRVFQRLLTESGIEEFNGPQGRILYVLWQQDGRQVIVKLTPRARGLEEKYDQVSERMNSLFYQGMTQADADALDALLDRVLANLQELL